MPTYIQKIDDSDLSVFAEFNKVLSSGTGSDSGITINLSGSEEVTGGFITPSGVPNSNQWESSGTWTVEIEVDSGPAMGVGGSVRIVRLDSLGNILQAGSYTAGQGLNIDRIFNPVAPVWNEEDEDPDNRIAIEFRVTNNTASPQTVIIGVGTTNNEVITDITEDVIVVNINNSTDLFINGHQSFNNDIDLFLNGFDIHNDDSELFIQGSDGITTDLDLYIFGIVTITNSIDLFISSKESLNNNFDLYINGFGIFTDSLDLFIKSFDIIDDNIDLNINGKELINNSKELFIGGHITENNNINLYIMSKASISGNIDQFIYGNDIINDDIDFYINGVVALADLIDLYISGSGIININNSMNLIINGFTQKEPLSCPILDPNAAIQIGDDLIQVYQDRIDALINQLGKDVVFEFNPIIENCPNCEYDPIRKRSNGVYTIGGPRPFVYGQKCPWCKGRGLVETAVRKCFKCLIKWNPKDAEDYGISIRKYKDIVRFKTFAHHYKDLISARFAISNYVIENIARFKVRLIQEPVLTGLRESRYSVSFWELIDS